MSEGVPVSATDNTPTTADMFAHWMVTARSLRADDDWDAESASHQFDRWLAAERAKAWDEGKAMGVVMLTARPGTYDSAILDNPYREGTP